jgi:hypothetical protein
VNIKLLFATLVLSTTVASAQIYQLTAVGHVTSFSPARDSIINPTVTIGTEIRFSAKLNTSLPPTYIASDNHFSVFGIHDASFSFGDVMASGDIGGVQLLHAPGFDNVFFASYSHAFGGSGFRGAGLSFDLPKGSLDIRVVSPQTFDFTPAFDIGMFATEVLEGTDGLRYIALASLDSFKVERVDMTPVPEPSTYAVFLVVPLAASIWWRSRKTSGARAL